jgi:hypothetical protein
VLNGFGAAHFKANRLISLKGIGSKCYKGFPWHSAFLLIRTKAISSAPAQHTKQMTDFILDLTVFLDRPAHCIEQKFAKFRPQPRCGCPQCDFIHIEPKRHLRIITSLSFVSQERAQALEQLPSSLFSEPGLQSAECIRDERDRPLPIECGQWIIRDPRFESCRRAGSQAGKWNGGLSGSAFLRPLFVPLIPDVVFQAREKKSAKPSAGRMDGIKPKATEKLSEKTLRQILGVLGAVALPTKKSINWRPIFPA